MGTVGIQKALVKNVNVETIKSYGGNVLIELIEDHAFLEAYVDETCLGANTQNPKETLENVRWLLIRQHVWTNYRSLYPTMGKQEFFDTLIRALDSLDSKDYKLFNGNEVKITKEDILSQSPIGNLGAIYMLMPYNNFPEYEIGNVYIVALGKPQILYTQFKFPKNGYIPLEHHDRRATYGQTVNVEVYTHLLPDCRSQGKQFDFEVELFNERGEVLSKSGLESLKSDGEYSYNNRYKLSFLIDIDWQKKHGDKEKDEKFYLKIKGRERFSQPSIYDPDRVVFNGDEYNSKENDINWTRFERGKWVCDSSGVLLVPFDTFAEMMGRFETQKNNTIQYIGDIKYTKREFDPCGYKRIKVKSGDREVYLFDEDKTNISSKDHTSRYFDIIAGDSPKEVVITAEGLQHAPNHLCTGVLLPAGQKHDSWEKIFQMGHVQPAEKGERGYKTKADDTDINHPDDRDVYASTSKGVSVNVSDVQMLTFGEDYFKASDNAIVLKLGYRYNKTYNDKILDYLSIEQKWLKYGQWGDAIANLWVVRYLLMLIERVDMYQSYFVPISTCRYPNQIVKIRLFPDMKWVFNFNYNIETPLYYKANTELVEHYSGFNEGKINTSNSNKRKEILNKKISNDLQHYVGRKTTFGLYVECEVSGQDDVIKLGDEFGGKFRAMCAPLFWMVDTLDSALGISDAKEKQATLLSSRNTKKGLWARLNKLPMSFELSPPSIGAGIGIGYGTSQQGTMSYELEGRIQANPIIGANVKLDILALGSKFKPWGAIIDALDIASWATNLFSGGRVELDYKIEVRFSAEVKLVGKKLKEAADGEPVSYEPQANFKYNFADKKLDFYGGIEGIIKGEIEVSIKILLQAKAKNIKKQPLGDKKNKKAELSIGVQGSSYVSLSCPFEINEEGGLDVDLYFSGVKIEVWFRASYSSKNSDGEPDYSEKIIPSIDKTKTIKF